MGGWVRKARQGRSVFHLASNCSLTLRLRRQRDSDEVFKRTFVHIPSSVGAFEAEEVGVEHLLRDIKNASTSTLATKVNDKIEAR